jgi:hypothetical protein
MTRLPSGEICGGEPEPNLLELGFVVSGVGDAVVGRSLIMRSVVPRVRGSTASDPLSSLLLQGLFLIRPPQTE